MARWIRERPERDEACLAMSLLAFSRDAGDWIRDYTLPEGGWEGKVEQCVALAAQLDLQVRLWHLTQHGNRLRLELDRSFKATQKARVANILIIVSPTGNGHAVPLASPRYGMEIPMPKGWFRKCPSGASADAAGSAEVKTAEPRAVAEKPAIVEVAKGEPLLEWLQGFSSELDADWKEPRQKLTWVGNPKPRPRVMKVVEAWKYTYAGAYPPPAGCQWIHGWMPQFGRPFTFWTKVNELFAQPQVASATRRMVEQYGTSVLYLPYTGPTLEGRYLAFGTRREEVFAAGDVIECGSARYVAETRRIRGQTLLRLCLVEGTLLDLVPRSVSAGGFRLTLRGTKVTGIHKPVTGYTQRDLNSAAWAATVMTSSDAVTTAILTRWKQKVSADDYADGTMKAHTARELAEIIRSLYPEVKDIKGAFGWGYCYSCGSAGNGRMKGRICKACSGRNSDLGRLIAQGESTCSAAAPIRYPGVVWTPSRHPPLKSGVNSVATTGNFPVAPTA